jgi:sulfide:quinone oxidoreductase
VTPEEKPLGLLGREASEAVADRLAGQAIRFLPMTYPERSEHGQLRLVPGPSVQVDAVVSLPKLKGVPLAGVPRDEDYFIPVDRFCRVDGLDDVYAAGDITTFPVKQGGIAAQQADAAAAAIAASAGADVPQRDFDPVLRGLLLGDSPVFLRAELAGGHGTASSADSDALWWPASKIASRYLSPYLAEHAGLAYGARRGPGSLV